MRKKVLLLNPPGSQIYVRDYYCSKVSKAHYLYHPVDLLMLSGTVSQQYDIRVIDGMIDGWTADTIAEASRFFDPDAVIFLTGVVSYLEDFRFIQHLKNEFQFAAIASGELFLDEPAARLAQFDGVDGAVLDFTSQDILSLLARLKTDRMFEGGDPIPNIVYRSGDDIISGPVTRGKGEEFDIPIPCHELFPNHHYRYPFVRRFPFATVLTDFGCPYHCQFCAISKLGFKKRRIENVLDELDVIRHMGFKDIYFDDQTFGADRHRTELLLEEMINRKYGLGFICFTRADVVDREYMRLMREAGCHTLVFGVESKVDSALAQVGKGLTIERIEEAVSWCRALGIRSVGTFIIGLPGMNPDEAGTIGEFAIRLGLEFASFNVPVPRPGTDLRKLAIRQGWIEEPLQQMDQSGSYAVMGNENMTADEILYYRNQASRTFYLRPGYLIHRLLSIRTFHELKSHFREMKNLIHPKRFVRHH